MSHSVDPRRGSVTLFTQAWTEAELSGSALFCKAVVILFIVTHCFGFVFSVTLSDSRESCDLNPSMIVEVDKMCCVDFRIHSLSPYYPPLPHNFPKLSFFLDTHTGKH